MHDRTLIIRMSALTLCDVICLKNSKVMQHFYQRDHWDPFFLLIHSQCLVLVSIKTNTKGDQSA